MSVEASKRKHIEVKPPLCNAKRVEKATCTLPGCQVGPPGLKRSWIRSDAKPVPTDQHHRSPRSLPFGGAMEAVSPPFSGEELSLTATCWSPMREPEKQHSLDLKAMLSVTRTAPYSTPTVLTNSQSSAPRAQRDNKTEGTKSPELGWSWNLGKLLWGTIHETEVDPAAAVGCMLVKDGKHTVETTDSAKQRVPRQKHQAIGGF